MNELGYDFIDVSRSWYDCLKNVKPSGPSHFREAYAYGVGMMLEYNRAYLKSNDP